MSVTSSGWENDPRTWFVIGDSRGRWWHWAEWFARGGGDVFNRHDAPEPKGEPTNPWKYHAALALKAAEKAEKEMLDWHERSTRQC